MKNQRPQSKELAALHALGALDGEEARTFARLLRQSPQARAEVEPLERVAEALAKSLSAPKPNPALKQTILDRAAQTKARAATVAGLKSLLPPVQAGLSFLPSAAGVDWMPLPVAGAFVKLLSFDDASGYAVVLGKLEPGARYPSHAHQHPEDIYMLTGELHVGDELIRAGDFHHAAAGSRHGVNWSEHGCVLLCVLSKEDLLAQIAPG